MMRAPAIAAVVGALMLSACAGKSGISGAAMMRVEVDVYKGPVGEPSGVQAGELAALLSEAARSSIALQRQAVTLADSMGCRKPSSVVNGPDCPTLYQVIANTTEIAKSICDLPKTDNRYRIDVQVYRSDGSVVSRDICEISDKGKDAEKESNSTPENSLKRPIPLEWVLLDSVSISRIAHVALLMQNKARRSADSNIGYVPRSKLVRNVSVNQAYMFSEFAKSISSRAFLYDKLIEKCRRDAQIQDGDKTLVSDSSNTSGSQSIEPAIAQCLSDSVKITGKLPTSDYLRDVEPTRYLDAFDWFNADLDSFGTGAYARRNRERGIKALNNGLYWEKVNEVYASGQGDVSMAFIKDELGNWNLKSYTNDPSELLKAYRQGANALISMAVDVARKGLGGPAAVARGSSILDLADRFATGRSTGAANIGGLSITALHDRADQRLTALKERFKERLDALGAADGSSGLIKVASDDLNAVTERVSNAQVALARDVAREANARAALRNCGDTCSEADTEMTAASVALQASRIEATAATAQLRGKQDALAVLKAEHEQMGGVAAEQAMLVLQEHQRDLVTLQQVVVSETTTPQVPTPGK